jgi:signal transduction histidine kinase
MTEEFIRERLFHPFATTKKKGIGLGLYSCRDIIEQHGGRIEVTSELDVGTEFRVVLPLAGEGFKTGDEQEVQGLEVRG